MVMDHNGRIKACAYASSYSSIAVREASEYDYVVILIGYTLTLA
jgi:hypothetical protein